MLLLRIFFCSILPYIQSTPIKDPDGPSSTLSELWPQFCYLPPEYRGVDGGIAEFMEDCDTLGKIYLSTRKCLLEIVLYSAMKSIGLQTKHISEM